MKTLLVTGGSKGIGLGITKEFLNNGYFVIVVSRNPDHIEHENTYSYKCDLKDESSIKAVFNEIKNKFGKLDSLVNNCGISKWKSINKITNYDFDLLYNTNVKSVLFTIQHSLPLMPKGSSIVNVSSLAGKRGSSNNSLYCGTKFAVNGITQSLAKELGKDQIRVNAVCPVLIETDGLNKALEDSFSPKGKISIKEFYNSFADNNSALQRLPTSTEVAKMVLFLNSNNASAITGQCINVDCGVFPQ